MQREVDYHANIINFYGISKLEMDSNKYLLVMEYADGGSLQSYLKEDFDKLEWNDKYKLAFQLANAVSCMHNEGIIHCDLVSQQCIFFRLPISAKIINVLDYLYSTHKTYSCIRRI